MQLAGQLNAEECERKVLGFTHSEISAEALRRSGMPEELAVAALYHHRPADDPTVCEPGRPICLSDLVHAANSFATELGYGVFPPEASAQAKAAAETHDSPVRARISDGPELAGEFQELFGNLTNAMGM
jgi:hypothetical protein